MICQALPAVYHNTQPPQIDDRCLNEYLCIRLGDAWGYSWWSDFAPLLENWWQPRGGEDLTAAQCEELNAALTEILLHLEMARNPPRDVED